MNGGGLRGRVQSFAHAITGLTDLLRHEPNARVHAVATVAVCALGAALDVSRADWRWLVAAICGVWAAEAFNTALEALADAVEPDHDARIKRAKDVAAAGVLVAALGAAIVGLLVLGPPLLARL
jgi:diacylglycerol kinase